MSNEIESRLPVDGKLVVFQCTGAACDSPIFYEGAKCSFQKDKALKFHFSSYGMVPPNHEEFEHTSGFGMCGSSGWTNDIHVVARAIKSLNEKKRVGLCEGFVIKELIKANYQIEQLDDGFR